MLINKLQTAYIEALKAHDDERKSILSIVINKCKMAELNARTTEMEVTDADLLNIIQKTLKELADEKSSFLEAGRLDKIPSIEFQENILQAYLPKQLDEAAIRSEIGKLEDKNLPNIMKHFKMNFSGLVDMSLVSKIARELNS